MPHYLSPNPYVQEVNNPPSIQQKGTSLAAFVGPAETGPTGRAVRVRSYTEFMKSFGKPASNRDRMALAVQTFFANGGKSAVICRVGEAGTQASTKAYAVCFNDVLAKQTDISMVILPGEQWAADGSGNPALKLALKHCETMGDRMLIVDPPESVRLSSAKLLANLDFPESSYAALYYPWVRIPNPFALQSRRSPRTLRIPPSAFAAGIWARTDYQRGVWKAPAGRDANLHGSAGLQYAVTSAEQSILNPKGVNCLRTLPGIGTVIWGSRTLGTEIDSEFRYIPVRRTEMMIKDSLREGTRWAVFEPNDANLWQKLRISIANFMSTLYRSGAFQGYKPEEAFFVQCGLGETMTANDIRSGILRVTVGFAPLKPAEFVVVHIGHKMRR